MKIGHYKQMINFLLRPKHLHHGTIVTKGVPYVFDKNAKPVSSSEKLRKK